MNSSPHKAIYPIQQIRERKGLRKEISTSKLKALSLEPGIEKARHENYRDLAKVRLEVAECFKATHFRHLHIQEDKANGVLGVAFQRLNSVVHQGNFVPTILQESAQQVPDARVIVGYENSNHAPPVFLWIIGQEDLYCKSPFLSPMEDCIQSNLVKWLGRATSFMVP